MFVIILKQNWTGWMTMNLNTLFKKQKQLDDYIGKTKDIDMENYKYERVIALQVEFNELLNELPFLFKYWSRKKMNREKALEEYVDGIHFILSIGNDFGITEYEYEAPVVHDMRTLAMGINNMITRIYSNGNYEELVDHYLLFGEKLGFAWEEIEQAYNAKHEVNYERQANGY